MPTSGDGLTWRPDGRSLVFATLGEGAGPPNVTGIWQIADTGGSAHLLIGTPAGVREKGYPAGSPLQQPTHFMFSPNGAYLAMDPDNRLWVAHADGTQGRFFALHLARGCVLAQSTWLADSSGLAYVTLCAVPSSSSVPVLSRLYSITVHGATPHLLYALTDPDQGKLDLAPAYGTGFYGSLTQAGVKKFQCAQNIICSGTPGTTGWGSVGPRTRRAVNAF